MDTLPTIVADIRIPWLESIPDTYARLHRIPAAQITREFLCTTKATALLVRTRTRCDAKLMDGSQVRFIGTATIGTDHINLAYCRQNGIEVASAPGCNAGGVMQYVASAIVSYCNARQCSPRGKILGIVGLGHVGKRVKRLGEALGMEVLVNDPPLQQAGTLDESIPLVVIIRCSDIISIHVPLCKSGDFQTIRLINRENMSLIKPSACLINTSRGGVVDETAVAEFHHKHSSFCYVADVWENEPVISHRIFESCFLATPHIAGYSIDGKRNATLALINELSRFYNWPAIPTVPPLQPPPEAIILAGSLEEALLKIYPIREDDKLFRENPGRFEELRDNYLFRHEYGNYSLQLTGHTVHKQVLPSLLGFKADHQ